MSEKTNIAWCDSTLNFWSGCTKVSPGCAHCYAETLSKNKFFGGGKTIGKWGKGAPRALHESAFKMAVSLNRKPWICDECGHAQPQDLMCGKCGKNPHHRRRIFSLSLGDWLDAEVPIEWLARMLDTIRQCDQVIWILCTKRPENWLGHESPEYKKGRLEAVQEFALNKQKNELFQWLCLWGNGYPPKHIILLTSVEDQPSAEARIPELLKIPAACRGLSLEPLLGPVKLNLATRCDTGNCQHYTDAECPGNAGLCVMQYQLDWLIIGGESGPGARPCNIGWIRSLAAQGKAAGVATFVKQLGKNPYFDAKVAPLAGPIDIELKDKKGGDLSEWPADLQIREFPILK